jgi:hypothetical protein
VDLPVHSLGLAIHSNATLAGLVRANAQGSIHKHGPELAALRPPVDIRRDEIFHTPGRFGWTGGLAQQPIPILQRERSASSLRPAHDGFAGAAEDVYRFLDAGVWSDGIDPINQGCAERDR